MELTKTLLNRESLLKISQFSIFLTVMIIAPMIGNQFITGSIVNSLLLISTMSLGLSSAILLSFLPSAISLSLGFLPWVMAPMVPFIVLGNILFVYAFNYLRKHNYWLGAISGSFLKFALLFFASNVVISLFIKQAVASKIAVMMSWPQLITALLGSMIAFLAWKIMNK
jgi:hypothetical protein